jgi:hypothetical protein
MAACLTLCVAGALKLRSPRMAAGALGSLGLPAHEGLVRLMAVGELTLGAACAVQPTRATAAVLTGAYATFAGVAAVMVGRRVACGCFGLHETPVSLVHVATSAALGAVALAAAVAVPHGVGWWLGRPVLALGIAGASCAVVLLYVEVPRAWGAWRGP